MAKALENIIRHFPVKRTCVCSPVVYSRDAISIIGIKEKEKLLRGELLCASSGRGNYSNTCGIADIVIRTVYEHYTCELSYQSAIVYSAPQHTNECIFHAIHSAMCILYPNKVPYHSRFLN